MDIRDCRRLKTAAAETLSHYPGEKQLVLIWAGVTAALSVIVSLLNVYLDSLIGQTGGLSGIGLRSALSTLQSVLSVGSGLLLPFWSFGYLAAMLRIARKQSAPPATLLHGFRIFGPVLRLVFLRYLILIGLWIGCLYGGVLLLSFTPLANPVNQLLLEYESILIYGIPDDAMLAAMVQAMMPIFIGCCILSIAVILPVFYKLRLADYLLLDDPRMGGMMALRLSSRLMRKNRFSLLKLDLSFWWFYLAQVLIAALGYADLFLPELGIQLPMSDDIAAFVFYFVTIPAQLVLFWLCRNRVQVTYALFYEELLSRFRDSSLPTQETNTP